MRRHGYSSSTTSPAMIDDGVSPAPAVLPSEPASPDHTETQRSLQQASAALEAAYHRIRQVRRNLLEVTENMPSTDPQTRAFEPNSVGPDHDAIVLTGSFVDDPVDLEDEDLNEQERSPIPRVAPDLRGTDSFRDLPPLTTPGLVNPAPPNMLNSPYFSHRPYPLPRRSQLENQFSRRREAYQDDASTSLGRRVAAREAAGAPNSGPPATLNSLASYDGNSAHLLASIERDIEHFRAMGRQRRTEPAIATSFESAAVPASIRLGRTVDVDATRRASQAQNATVGVSASPVGSHPESRRRRLIGGIYSSRPSVSTQSERLSLLSNFSVQNLPTPVSANPRPLIFDEPSSYIQAANFTQPEIRHDPWEDLIEEHEQRNYVIRRRYNADGEEHVHPINLEWIDESPSWIGPAILREHERRLRESTQSVQDGGISAGPRRRGWARLDPDGNEIPSDEEEELERIRAEYRLQAQSRPRSTADGPNSHPGFHSLQAATTSTSLTPDEDAGITDSIPRVRLNARESRPFYGSVMDSVITVDTLRRQESLPSHATPFCANPLPMPIEEMVWSPPKRKPPRVVIISKHASLAGR